MRAIQFLSVLSLVACGSAGDLATVPDQTECECTDTTVYVTEQVTVPGTAPERSVSIYTHDCYADAGDNFARSYVHEFPVQIWPDDAAIVSLGAEESPYYDTVYDGILKQDPDIDFRRHGEIDFNEFAKPIVTCEWESGDDYTPGFYVWQIFTLTVTQ